VRSKRCEASTGETGAEETYTTPEKDNLMAASTVKTALHATAKVDGKVRTWIVAIFNDLERAKPFAALLKMAYATKDVDTVKAMDPHAPIGESGELAESVKFSVSHAQYNPIASGLDDAI